MDWIENYLEFAESTDVSPSIGQQGIAYHMCALAGELGELLKTDRGSMDEFDELGDIYWNLIRICDSFPVDQREMLLSRLEETIPAFVEDTNRFFLLSVMLDMSERYAKFLRKPTEHNQVKFLEATMLFLNVLCEYTLKYNYPQEIASHNIAKLSERVEKGTVASDGER